MMESTVRQERVKKRAGDGGSPAARRHGKSLLSYAPNGTVLMYGLSKRRRNPAVTG